MASTTFPSLPDLWSQREGWEEEAACRGHDVDLFFSIEETEQELALDLCSSCDVREECLVSVLKRHEMYGIWGGMLEHDRRLLIRDLRRRERELNRLRTVDAA